jgi:hypothetical protein
LFKPVSTEAAVVAPVIVHIRVTTAQLSALVGFGVITLLEQVPAVTVLVIFAGHVMVGTMLSVIVTVKEQVAVLLAASRTVYVTVVMPELKVCVPALLIPVAGEVATVAPVIAHVKRVTAQLSPVVGFGVTTEAEQVPATTFWVMFAGQVTVGTMLSVTVIVKAQVAVLFAASRTV